MSSNTTDTAPPKYTSKPANDHPSPTSQPDLPTATTAENSNTAPPRSTIAIIALRHCDGAAGAISARALKDTKPVTFAGKTLTTLNIALKVTDVTSYQELTGKIYERVEETWHIKMDSRKSLYRGLNLMVDGKSVFIMDEASWEPCRDLLVEGKGTLSFSFWETKDVPIAESESVSKQGKKKGGKCRVQ